MTTEELKRRLKIATGKARLLEESTDQESSKLLSQLDNLIRQYSTIREELGRAKG